MAVFRVEKTKDYTVMSNYHLKDKRLTLKAKGLLSQMLSLPDDWDYTVAGLSKINKEKIDAIRTAIIELEQYGYITRNQHRKEHGTFGDIEYIIHEQPILENPITVNQPILENPISDNPISDNPISDNPISENPTQLNTNILNTNIPSTKSSSSGKETQKEMRMKKDDTDDIMQQIADNIDLSSLLEEYKNESDKKRILMLFSIIVKVVCSRAKTIRINSEDLPAKEVKAAFKQLGYQDICYVAEKLNEPKEHPIQNLESYIKTLLYNAHTTADEYWTQRVLYDQYGGGAEQQRQKRKSTYEIASTYERDNATLLAKLLDN